jgi:hypothetical protein
LKMGKEIVNAAADGELRGVNPTNHIHCPCS